MDINQNQNQNAFILSPKLSEDLAKNFSPQSKQANSKMLQLLLNPTKLFQNLSLLTAR